MKIALSGISGSGKSTVAQYLGARYNFALCAPGQVCRKVTHLIFGVSDKTNLNRVDTAIRAIDPNVWIKASLREIDRDDVVLDGARYWSNYEYLAPLGFEFWKIELSSDLAEERLIERGQIFNNAVDRQYIGEHEFNSYPFSRTLTNQGSVADLMKQVDEAMFHAQHSS